MRGNIDGIQFADILHKSLRHDDSRFLNTCINFTDQLFDRITVVLMFSYLPSRSILKISHKN